MEFGRTPGCFRDVLAVLGDGEELVAETFQAAVTLADAGHARLTLAKTRDPGTAYVWIAPFAVGAAYVPPALDSPEAAAQVLAQVAAQVPATIPVTTFVLGTDKQRCLLELLRRGCFGAVVVDAGLLSHCRRLRRELQREQIWTVGVGSDSPVSVARRRLSDRVAGLFTPAAA